MAGDLIPHEGVIIVDRNKRVVFADARTCQLLKTDPSDLIGRHCAEVRGLFPCGEESCQLTSDCRLFSEGQALIRSNHLATFSSQVVAGLEGEKLGTIHMVSLPEPTSREVGEQTQTRFPEIVGVSAPMQKLFELVELVSKTDVTVHIHGESGTGKELVAEAIHRLSERSSKRLIKVNCSTIAPTLLESALFGHVKGAYTGAHKDQRGFVENAEGGTLFLDEIGDISLDIQVKLLRLLQSRDYQRVGESQTRHVDLRIVTATNQDLLQLVRQGKMREDFYYRINVFPITIPALRERLEDLPLLVQHFISLFNSRFSKEILGVSDSALQVLRDLSWPGNVRELEHAIEHAFVKASNGYLQPEHLPAQHNSAQKPVVQHVSVKSEEQRIREALKNSNGRIAAAASQLGFSRVTLWKKMKKAGISSRNTP